MSVEKARQKRRSRHRPLLIIPSAEAKRDFRGHDPKVVMERLRAIAKKACERAGVEVVYATDSVGTTSVESGE